MRKRLTLSVMRAIAIVAIASVAPAIAGADTLSGAIRDAEKFFAELPSAKLSRAELDSHFGMLLERFDSLKDRLRREREPLEAQLYESKLTKSLVKRADRAWEQESLAAFYAAHTQLCWAETFQQKTPPWHAAIEKAASRLEGVIEGYPQSRGGFLARVDAARLAFLLGRKEEAIKALTSLRDNAPTFDLKMVAMAELARLSVAQGDGERATDTIRQMRVLAAKKKYTLPHWLYRTEALAQLQVADACRLKGLVSEAKAHVKLARLAAIRARAAKVSLPGELTSLVEKKLDNDGATSTAAEIIEQGDRFFRSEQFEAAAASYRMALQGEDLPGRSRFRVEHQLAKCLVKLGKNREAIEHFERALKTSDASKRPDILWELILAGVSMYFKKQPAAKDLERLHDWLLEYRRIAGEKGEHLGEAWLYLSMTDSAMGRWKDALDSAEKAAMAHVPGADVALARCCLRLSDLHPDNAKQWLEKALAYLTGKEKSGTALVPDETERQRALLLAAVYAHPAIDQPKRALEVLDRLEKASLGGPLPPEGKLTKVRALIALGRLDEAVACADKLEQSKASADTRGLAALLVAAEACSRLEKKASHNKNMLRVLVVKYALAYAATRSPTDVAGRLTAGTLLLRAGAPEKALPLLTEAYDLASGPGLSEEETNRVTLALAEAKFALRQDREALALYKKVPRSLFTQEEEEHFALCAFECGELDVTENLLRRCVFRVGTRDWCEANWLRAAIALRRGNRKRAQELIKATRLAREDCGGADLAAKFAELDRLARSSFRTKAGGSVAEPSP